MTLDTFEQSLLTTLRGHVAARTPTPQRSMRRRRLAIPAAVAAGLAAIAVTLGLTLMQPSAAYAVDKAGNGDIVVTIHRLDDAAGLEKALRANGINADVDYDPSLPQDLPKPGSSGAGTSTRKGTEASTSGSGEPPAGGSSCTTPRIDTRASKDAFTMRIPADDYTGDVLHVTTSGSLDGGVIALQVRWASTGC